MIGTKSLSLDLVIPDAENHFELDFENFTNNFGLMQINIINHDWHRSMDMDPLTYTGNIESGIYVIEKYP